MSFVKVWIHAVWATKNREPLLINEIRSKVFDHIHTNGLEKGILIDTINGHLEHVHCMFRLKNDQTIKKVLQLMKGESSFWINKNKLTQKRFEWQSDYYAVSVSESQVEAVRRYIINQEEHHKKRSYLYETEEFIKRFGFHKFKG